MGDSVEKLQPVDLPFRGTEWLLRDWSGRRRRLITRWRDKIRRFLWAEKGLGSAGWELQVRGEVSVL